MLWLGAALLVALALAFTVWPLLKHQGPPRPAASRQALMRDLYRDRLAEIDREAASGQLDPQTRAAVEEELGANLLDEFQQARAGAAAAPSEQAPSRRRVGPMAWLLAVLVPAAGVAVYLSAGEPDAAEIAGAAEVLRLDPNGERPRIEEWRDRLARRVAGRPGDAQSWYLLGISRLQLGEFTAAADAFARARELVDGDPNIDLYWLQSRYLAAGGELDATSRTIAERVLAARPGHPLVLEMYAIEAYRKGAYRQAVEHLNRALGNPLPPAQSQALLAGLQQARSRMETLTPSVDVAIAAPAAVPGNATVFVIARPPGGGMPYAVVRRPASLLPLEVRLDDTVSMSEARGLSGAGEFEVVVRLSRSGSPTPAPGDWEWRSAPLAAADLTEPLRLQATLAPAGRAAAASAAAAAAPGTSAPAPALPGVAVDVSIAAPAEAPAAAALFVIARPPGGGMPYAVVRRPTPRLPLAVRLDDGASMTGGRRLSDAPAFEVVVRLSVSGNAMPGPGDWEWQSAVIEPASLAGPLALEARLAPREGT